MNHDDEAHAVTSTLYAPPTENVTRRLLRRVLDVVLPAACVACNKLVREPADSLGLCDDCRGHLVRWPSRCCATCGKTLDASHLPASYRCGECRRQEPPCAVVLSGWSYQPPIDAVLTGLKFRRLEYLGGQLARELARLFRDRLTDCDLVVPVPLHWRRYLSRGYNQAAAIATPLAAELDLPTASVLRRRLSTPAQSQLRRVERTGNLKGAFSVKRPSLCAGRHVLLIDDIVTTGTTVNTAARCLLNAGVASVTTLTAARTP